MEYQGMEPRLVDGFVAALGEADEALQRGLRLSKGSPAIVELVRGVKRGEFPSDGDQGEFHYQVHGVGCLISMKGGAQVDVDVTRDGRVVFDEWRLRSFARSTARDEGSPALAAAVLRDVANTGLLEEVRPGWFAVVDLRESS